MNIHHKQFFNGINLNGNTFSGIGNIGAIDSAGSLKYDNGALCYHNGTSWVSLGGGAKYMGELPEAVLPQGAQDGEVYRVMSSTQRGETYPAGTWRTFTSEEIDYIIHNRTNANALKYFCVIDGQYKGLLLLPDDFINTTGVAFIENATNYGGRYSQNPITIEQFKSLENEGAVFLPMPNIFNMVNLPTVAKDAMYWTGSQASDYRSSKSLTWHTKANDTDITVSTDFLRCEDDWWKNSRFAVRLIKNVDLPNKAFTITLNGNTYYIKFAHGNLQFNCKTLKFRFAKEQYNVITFENNGCQEAYNAYHGNPSQDLLFLEDYRWIDLMGYGTSTCPNTQNDLTLTHNYPSLITTRTPQYIAFRRGDITETNYDWGTYNTIGYISVYPAGSAFIVDNGELVPLCAGVPLDIYEQLPNIANKADKVAGATSGNFAGLDVNGNLTDSGVNPTDILNNSNYPIYAPASVQSSSVPVLLGVDFADIIGAFQQGKNPLLILTEQVGNDDFNVWKLSTCARDILDNIPDGHGGTITPNDGLIFYDTNVLNTVSSHYFALFVNPSDNETYIYYTDRRLQIPDNTFVIDATGGNQTDQYPNAPTFEQIINAYDNGKHLALKCDYSTAGLGFGVTGEYLLTDFDYSEIEVELTPPPDYTYRIDKYITFTTDKGGNLLFPAFMPNTQIVIGQGDAIQGTNEHKIAVHTTTTLLSKSFTLTAPQNATNGNVAIQRYEYNETSQEYDNLRDSISITGAGGTEVTTDASGNITISSNGGGGGSDYTVRVYPTDFYGNEVWTPKQVTRTELLFDTIETQYLSGKTPVIILSAVGGDTDQQVSELSLTNFEYYSGNYSLDSYYDLFLHNGYIQANGVFVFRSSKATDTWGESYVIYLYKGMDDNTYIYATHEPTAVMDIEYEGTWTSSYDQSADTYTYGMSSIHVAHKYFNLQYEPTTGVDAINRIYQLATQYQDSTFRIIYGNEEVISSTYYITLNGNIISVYINEWDSQQQAFVQRHVDAPLQVLQ